jgi:biopolymer transport protein ExbD
MQFEGRRRVSKVFDLTPIIDMVFLLLLFFMLTSHFVREETLAVDLPAADSGAEAPQDDRLEVVVTREGNVLIHEHIVERVGLAAVLKREISSRRQKVVQVRGDREVPLADLVAVLDAARAAGAEGVDILTTRP